MSKGQWVETQIEDIEIKYSFEKHKPVKLKGTPWLVCQYCGLLYINTPITKWCIKMGCNHTYHHDYNKMLKRTG